MESTGDLSWLFQALLSICLVAGSSVCSAQTGPLSPRPLPARIAQVLSWLPVDTETIFVANQEFAMPRFKPYDADEPSRELSPAELTERFDLLPLRFFEVKDGLLQNFLMGQRVEMALEGSRHFRRPSGLFGEMPYEGCEIAVLAEATVGRGESFLKQSLSSGLMALNDRGLPLFVPAKAEGGPGKDQFRR